MSLSRGHVRMLRQLYSQQIPDSSLWFRPLRSAQNRECVELHSAGYLKRRSAGGALEYRIDTGATVVKQAVDLGILT